MANCLKRLARLLVGSAASLLMFCGEGIAQTIDSVGIGDWLTVSTNLEGGGRWNELFKPDHHAALFQWDTRVEIWLPPSRKVLAWGPYLRVAGIASTGGEAWENAWLAAPGIGIQAFPALLLPFLKSGRAAPIAGPLRVFAEYDVVNYWGEENAFRPKRQRRIGVDYWKALNVNDLTHKLWLESWNGLYWQSSNEFTEQYRSLVAADALRVGLRFSKDHWTSVLTPYVLAESSWTQNARFYWENHLLAGVGVRAAPSLMRTTTDSHRWISRLVVYGEYVDTLMYYGVKPDASVPRHDFRVGLSANIGQWYR